MAALIESEGQAGGERREVDLPTGVLSVRAKPGRYALDALVGFAARANLKRGFLFVSKVLGKHWPVRPAAMRELHETLAGDLPADLPGPVVFIAMAETAVGLGQGVFEAWLDAAPPGQAREALFLHTTRYRAGDGPLIEFEEAHSHAPRQFLHMPADPALAATLARARSIVLVDDEASTGNTFVNLAAACRPVCPAVEHVHLVTITNFMGDEATARLLGRFDAFHARVTHSAALDGEFSFRPGDLRQGDAPAQRFDPEAERGASAAFGRLGLAACLPLPAALAASLAREVGAGERVLVLGTGEFMHPAFLLGRALERHGAGVVVQSTTRSPILQWGAVASALSFPDNYGEGIANFIYNVQPGQYQHVFVCHETPPNAALHALAAKVRGRLFHFQSENRVEEIPVC